MRERKYNLTKRGRRILVFTLKPCQEGRHLECKRAIAGLSAFLSCNCICHTNKKVRGAAIAFSDMDMTDETPANHADIEIDDEDDVGCGGFSSRVYTFWRSMV